MAINDILTQDEIDALLHGVNSGDVDTDDSANINDGQARNYDFASQDRILKKKQSYLKNYRNYGTSKY